jgi:hypothetical protein
VRELLWRFVGEYRPGMKTSATLFRRLLNGLAIVLPVCTCLGSTQLGVRGVSFTTNGKPSFLLGISYYGGLGASDQSMRQDLDEVQRLGFNWCRIWATWNAFGRDVSAVNTHGTPRPPFMEKLQRFIGECDRRGLIVDVTLTRGEILRTLEAHEQAVETLVKALRSHDNWFIDLANEHDVRDARFVSDNDLEELRARVKSLDPSRLVTASFGGQDLTREQVRKALMTIRMDFLAPHRPRTRQSPAETESRTRELLAQMETLGRMAPVLYQEPFRRGYNGWEPRVEDFLEDLRGAKAGRAAGWCFHNGQQGDAPEKQPRRSFDLRFRGLFEQLDPVEHQVVLQAGSALRQ